MQEIRIYRLRSDLVRQWVIQRVVGQYDHRELLYLYAYLWNIHPVLGRITESISIIIYNLAVCIYTYIHYTRVNDYRYLPISSDTQDHPAVARSIYLLLAHATL